MQGKDFSFTKIQHCMLQSDDKNFRHGSAWRRQFPPREVHGISMMPGSSETLPAGFRLTTTSGQSRKMATDGKPINTCFQNECSNFAWLLVTFNVNYSNQLHLFHS